MLLKIIERGTRFKRITAFSQVRTLGMIAVLFSFAAMRD